jgi:hypothetical protein
MAIIKHNELLATQNNLFSGCHSKVSDIFILDNFPGHPVCVFGHYKNRDY